MASHYRISTVTCFPDEDSAQQIIDNSGVEKHIFQVMPCHCDNLNWAERLAWRWPKFFMWLLKREFNESDRQ